MKTTRPETKLLLDTFQPNEEILGGDPRVPKGREKPEPEIHLTALREINEAAHLAGNPILPNECLVFEGSVIGVEAGRRVDMGVVWVPHPELAVAYHETHHLVPAGWTGPKNDSWAEYIPSLEDFDYEKYGIFILRLYLLLYMRLYLG